MIDNNKNGMPEEENDAPLNVDDIEFLNTRPEGSDGKKKNMAARRKTAIMVSAVLFVILLIVYFAVVAPMLRKEETPPPELLEGEDVGTDNRILLFPSVDKSDIRMIEVHNSSGDFSFTYSAESDDFYLTDNQIFPLEKTVMSNFVVSARHTLSMERVTKDATEKELGDYGLGKNDDPAWYVLTDNKNNRHKVYIGKEIVTGTGYYCRYEGRNAVYILDTSVAAFTRPVEAFISPIISYPADSKDYYYNILQCGVVRDGEVLFNIRHLDQAEKADSASLTEYEMVEPAGYVPSSTNYPHILQEFCNFVGSSTVYAGLKDRGITDEILDKYGVSEEKAKYTLFYNYKVEDSVVPSIVYFSEKDENGFLYAYSVLFNTIIYVSSEKTYFLDWDFIDYVDRKLFQRNINDIAEVSVESEEESETFFLKGEGEDIKISQKSDGREYGGSEVKSFRQYFRKLLTISIEDYAENTETENCMLTLRIKTDAGKTFEYKFYPYSTRRCFFTIDGEGEFYVLRSVVEKLIEDIDILHSGGMVDYDDIGI